ncbi:hypothetical protein [Halogeometricum borinquense]|uniref:hypothetical protein n=1 Tax=Halogeometricum borinquense TaxID=60847 RepID=UPI0034497671
MSDTHERRESIRFSEAIPPGETETLRFEVTQDCTVEEITVRIYKGPQLDLHIVPFVERGEDGRRRRTDLLRTEGKEYIDGDDDRFTFAIEEGVEEDEIIGVEVENTDDTNIYDFACHVTIDRAGGTVSRLWSWVTDIGGWF